MKQIIASLFLSVAVLSGCKGQNNEETNKSINQPQTEVTVNKEYDENGNVIRYDSTYSYYYSNIDGDYLLEDSIISNFKDYFNKNFGFPSSPFFDEFFIQDSLMQYNLFNNDIFLEMDSIRSHFFGEQFNKSNNKNQ